MKFQTRLSFVVTAACLLFNSTVIGHPIPALSSTNANLYDSPIERRSDGKHDWPWVLDDSGDRSLWQTHSYHNGFSGHPTAVDHDWPIVTGPLVPHNWEPGHSPSSLQRPDHAHLQHQPTHLDVSLSRADSHNHLSAGQPSFGYLPSLPQLEAHPQCTSGAEPVSFPHPPSHQHEFLPQSNGNLILSTPLTQGDTIPSAHSYCDGFLGHPNAVDHDSWPIITGPLMPQNWVHEHSPSFLQPPNNHDAPPQQMHPVVSLSQAHPHANNNHWGAGRPLVELLPQIQHQGTSSVEPVSFPHPQSHQDNFLPQSDGNLTLSTRLTQGKSVQNLGSHIPSPQNPQSKRPPTHDAQESTPDPKKQRVVLANRKKEYKKLLAGYELDLSDQVTRDLVKAEQEKWWKEQEKTHPRKYRLYKAMLEERQNSWKIPQIKFTNTQIEILKLGFTRERLMSNLIKKPGNLENPARTKATRNMRFYIYLQDQRNQRRVEAELKEWKAKLNSNDPDWLKEVEQRIERIRSDNGWDSPEAGLSKEEVKILELGEQRIIMRRIGSNPSKWAKKKSQVSNLYQQVALALNKMWNGEDRSKLASVREELKAAVPMVMLNQSSRKKIIEMGTLRLLDAKAEALQICRTEGRKGYAAFLGYIQGLQKNEKSGDVADVQRLLGDKRFREDNDNEKEFENINGDDNEEDIDGAREGVGEKQHDTTRGPSGVSAQPM